MEASSDPNSVNEGAGNGDDVDGDGIEIEIEKNERENGGDDDGETGVGERNDEQDDNEIIGLGSEKDENHSTNDDNTSVEMCESPQRPSSFASNQGDVATILTSSSPKERPSSLSRRVTEYDDNEKASSISTQDSK